MPMPQLKVRSISASIEIGFALQPGEDGRQGEAAEIDLSGEMLRQHARDILGEPAAGDMRQALTAPVVRIVSRIWRT